MKTSFVAATIFTAIMLAPATGFGYSAEGASLVPATYYQHRNFSHYLPKFYGYQQPGRHYNGSYKRGYRSNRYYRPHRYNRRYGARNSYRYGRRGYR